VTLTEIRDSLILAEHARLANEERISAEIREKERLERIATNQAFCAKIIADAPAIEGLFPAITENGVFLLFPECCPIEIRGVNSYRVKWGKDLESYSSNRSQDWGYNELMTAVEEARRLWIEIDTQEKAWALEAQRQAERDAAWVKAQEEQQAAGPVAPQDPTSRMMRAQESIAESLKGILAMFTSPMSSGTFRTYLDDKSDGQL